MANYPDIGVLVGEILTPAMTVDLQKWSVIACDQYTSQPEYWQKVRDLVGESPSTLHLILPEAYLGTAEEQSRVHTSHAHMRRYLESGFLVPHQGLVYAERMVGGKTRRGLVLALDLDRYDFNQGSQSLIRATEGTILERLPPRIRIREGAPLELPHILVLIDDPQRTVIEPVVRQKNRLTTLYDTDLMLGSGHLSGYLVDQQDIEDQVITALRALANPEHFYQKYGVDREKGVLLFAVGDGNHSLATAKSIWEKIKPSVGPDHPARYALVEIENVHDEGLIFEPIHRVVFNISGSLPDALTDFYGSRAAVQDVSGFPEMVTAVTGQTGAVHRIGLIQPTGCAVLTISRSESNLPVGSLQAFLDDWGRKGGYRQIDYVHGDEVVNKLGGQSGNLGFYLPAMNKNELFRTVILDGSLPRKTFSLGEAHEKRFYMESRRITP